jgi:lipoprotein signal peptidase
MAGRPTVRKRVLRLLVYVAAVGVGAFPAFFVVFNAIFSDGGSPIERIATFVLTIVAYWVLGAAFGLFSSAAWWVLGFWISFPAIVIVALYSMRERERLFLHWFYLVLAVGAASLGARAGAWFRALWKSRTRS